MSRKVLGFFPTVVVEIIIAEGLFVWKPPAVVSTSVLGAFVTSGLGLTMFSPVQILIGLAHQSCAPCKVELHAYPARHGTLLP